MAKYKDYVNLVRKLYKKTLKEKVSVPEDFSKELDFRHPALQICAIETKLPEAERSYNSSGNHNEILEAISLCAKVGVPMPDWLCEAFLSRFEMVAKYELASWDEAFGKPFPGKQLDGLRRRYLNRPKVWKRVNELILEDPNRPLDSNREYGEGIYEQVSRELGIGRTVVTEYLAEEALVVEELLESARTLCPDFNHRSPYEIYKKKKQSRD